LVVQPIAQKPGLLIMAAVALTHEDRQYVA
jgi:hypothetical protein